MKWYIIRVVKKGRGALEYQDDQHYGDTLTIGRGTSQAIYVPDLRVALEHVKVSALAGGSQYRIESLIAAGVRVNGLRVQNAIARKGEHVDVGNLRITFVEPPADFAAAVEITPIDKSEQAAIADAEKLPTNLSETKLSKRFPSWLFFFAMLSFGLLIPLATHWSPAARSALKNTPLSTKLWLSGELAASHHAIKNDCQSCHVDGFTSVRDEQCLACHAETKAHADPHRFAVDASLFELTDAKCAYCHRDHNGKDGLIAQNQLLCADCHRDIKARTKNKTTLAAISDFGTDHVQFQINLPAWNSAGQFQPKRVSMNETMVVKSAGFVENSGLKYPHDKHVGLIDGLQSPKGKRVLKCESCHQPEPGGARMQAVDFETMCQDCHRLNFDSLAGDRQVPHAKINDVLAQLSDYYGKRALDGDYEEAAAPPVVRRRRIPGQTAVSLTDDEKRVALVWARDKAKLVARTLVEGKACGVCHSVSKVTSNNDLGFNYVIAPVRVAGSWYAKSEFTHGKHQTMNCISCHTAEQSGSSKDILIPEISNCRQCHGGEHATSMVASTCIDCHGFHIADVPLRMQAALRAQSERAQKATQLRSAAQSQSKEDGK